MPRISISLLGKLEKVAAGAQGIVYLTPDVRLPRASTCAFKQYKPHVVPKLEWISLEAMPVFIDSLAPQDADLLLGIAAWPCATVDDDGSVVGFLMPAIPPEYFIKMQTASGPSVELSEFQHLLNDDDFLFRRRINITDRDRFELLAQVARALDLFHLLDIAVGDLSPKNLLFALKPTPQVYFIDCDAMRVQGRTVLTQLETPDWDVHTANPSEELATVASDNYKLGLLALRLLAGDQSTRNPMALPRWVPEELEDLIRRAISPVASLRPAARAWFDPIERAIATASTQPPQDPLVSSPDPLSSSQERIAYGISAPVQQVDDDEDDDDDFDDETLFERHPFLAVMGLLIVLAILAMILVLGANASSSSASSTSSTRGARIEALTATAYSPVGQQDRPGDAILAIDHDESTKWQTQQYAEPVPTPKPGIGLMVTLRHSSQVRYAVIDTDTPGTVLTIRTASTPVPASIADTTYVGGGTLTDGENEISLEYSADTEYVLIWITVLGSDQNMSSINEVSLYA